jgi:hypothetical protein
MSHGLKTFLVCTESKWDESATFEWREVFMAGYVEAAKRIAKHLDAQDDEVKERRQFWLKEKGHEKPMLMNTYSEMVVEYYAEIQK